MDFLANSSGTLLGFTMGLAFCTRCIYPKLRIIGSHFFAGQAMRPLPGTSSQRRVPKAKQGCGNFKTFQAMAPCRALRCSGSR